ncbi:MAG: FAD-dependent oxidoreductase [Phycisphaerae bacterium]|nr:FAD-dependent oxidoreductase [Phycisphaerae bacterium]
MESEFLIIGGGPTGLGAALRLDEKSRDWCLLEASDHFGGLAASFKDEAGFTWDLGGHVQFSHYDTFDRYMDLALGRDGWLYHERESWVWVRNRFVPYPFQHNLHRLDPPDRDRCVNGLREAAQKGRGSRVEGRKSQASSANFQFPISNFKEWILATFGQGIADIFLLPYNFKVWAYPPEVLDYHWIGERVAVPDLDEVMSAIATGEDQVSWGPNRTFRFPRHGGTGAVWSSLGARLPSERYRLNVKVVEIDPAKKEARTNMGETFRYKHLISTMPLDQMIRCIRGFDDSEAERLVFSATNVIGIGMNGQTPEHLKTKCWMYFPENNSPYYRVTVFTNYSPNNAARPGEQWSLMAEVSESPQKPVDHKGLADCTIRALEQDGLLPDPKAICTVVTRHIPQAYPTPFLGRNGVVDSMIRRLEDWGIYSRGRFGAWKYEVSNQDHCFAQGYECVERLLNGGGPEFEPTLHTPSVVNARRNP